MDLEKVEEPEIKLPTSIESWKKQENSIKTSTSASLTILMPLTVWNTTVENWKILKVIGIADHITCLLRNLYAGPEATIRTEHVTMDWFKIGERVHQSCILLLCLFNLYAKYIMQNNELDESQSEIKIARRNVNNLRYADDTALVAESKEELKSLLMRVKEESEKASLKLSIKKTKIMAPSPITSWQIEGGNVAAVIDFLFWGSKITVDDDCSHEIRR